MSGGPDEVEATLLVMPSEGEGAAATADRVAGLRRLAGYRLGAGETVEMLDVYWDTPDRGLRDLGLALRLRHSRGRTILALKGEERLLPGGGLERLEIEGPWSRDAVDRVRAALRRRGLDLLDHGDAGVAAGPAEALEAMGLREVQRRTTTRRARRLDPPGGGAPAGELVVDRVEFRAPGRASVPHREVEVEAAGPAAPEVVAEVSSALLERFGGALRRWDHGKLDTGEAIGELARRGELEAAGPDGAPTPEDYARIEALLLEWKEGASG